MNKKSWKKIEQTYLTKLFGKDNPGLPNRMQHYTVLREVQSELHFIKRNTKKQ